MKRKDFFKKFKNLKAEEKQEFEVEPYQKTGKALIDRIELFDTYVTLDNKIFYNFSDSNTKVRSCGVLESFDLGQRKEVIVLGSGFNRDKEAHSRIAYKRLNRDNQTINVTSTRIDYQVTSLLPLVSQENPSSNKRPLFLVGQDQKNLRVSLLKDNYRDDIITLDFGKLRFVKTDIDFKGLIQVYYHSTLKSKPDKFYMNDHLEKRGIDIQKTIWLNQDYQTKYHPPK